MKRCECKNCETANDNEDKNNRDVSESSVDRLVMCPFCGYDQSDFAGMSDGSFGKCSDGTYSVCCSSCGCTGASGRSMIDAVNAWNRRAI
jgi:Lar family restriction alleviation protein